MGQPLIERLLLDVTATESLGAALARCVPWAAPQALTVFLHGELGAGKTTLVRGLLRELGVDGTVRSPTYTLLECYETAAGRVLHLDLYRLAGGAEVASLGLRDEVDRGVLLLIEWPERAAAALPPADLSITLSLAAAGRSARLEGLSPAGAAWLATATRAAASQK